MFFLWTIAPILAAGATLQTDPPEYPPFADDFLSRCERDGERLWGKSLCIPVVAVNPATGEHRTSETIFAPLPPIRANTAFDWAGEKWVMVLEPLPRDQASRSALLFHEAWHAHQEALDFPPNDAVAAHLEDSTARYLLRLEWTALAEALRSRGESQQSHIAQALRFRAQRLDSTPEAPAAERDQMRHEGLAAYTGIALSGAPERLALEELEAAAVRPHLGRSFAYVSGPAWGLLLDALRPGWREEIPAGGDLPDFVPIAPARTSRADDYGATRILLEESLRSLERRAQLAAAEYATHPARALRLPLAQLQMDFDPNQVLTATDGSPIYGRITLRDQWGRIEISGAALRISPDFSTAFAPWPLQAGQLELNEGWRLESFGQAARVVREP